MKRLIITLVAFIAMFTLFFTGVPVLAADDASKTAACEAIGGTFNGDTCSDGSTSSAQPQDIVEKIIVIFSWVVGAIAVIMLIFGGFKYITSGGDSNKITSAKNTIVFALIGLVVVVLAQTIVIFVLQRANNATTKQAASSINTPWQLL